MFLGCGVGKTTIAKVTKPLLTFFFAMIAALMCNNYVPSVSLRLPAQTKQLKAEDIKPEQFQKSPAVEKDDC